MTAEVLAYTVERIAAAKVTRLPFPYAYVDAVFEPSFWAQCVLRATAAAPRPDNTTLVRTLSIQRCTKVCES